MPIWRVNNATALGGEVCAEWKPDHAYSVGARVVCRIAYATTARKAWVYECTTAGTSAATGSEPAWPASGTRTDGPDTLVWTTRSPDDGDWNNATCYLNYIMTNAAVAAGDFFYLHNAHNEVSGMHTLGKSVSTPANPFKVLCVDKATDLLSYGAIVGANTGGLYFIYNAVCYGVTFKGTNVALNFGGSAASTWILYGASPTNVVAWHIGTGAIYIGPGGAYLGKLIIINGGIRFDHLDGNMQCLAGGTFIWKGGVLTCSATGQTNLFKGSAYTNVTIEAVDLSAIGYGANARCLLVGSGVAINRFDVIRCKLPSAAGFVVYSSAIPADVTKIRLHGCSSGNDIYSLDEESYYGSVKHELTVIKSGGANDGVTGISWKMVANANTKDGYTALESPPIASWTESASSKTFTISGVYSGAANLQNDEVWMELEYPADNSSGLGTLVSTQLAFLSAAADLAADAGSTWGGGLANENKFKLSVTVAPGKKGPITARVYLSKASATIYIDPVIIES